MGIAETVQKVYSIPKAPSKSDQVPQQEEWDAMEATLSVFCEAWFAGRPTKSPRLAKIAHRGYPCKEFAIL